MIYEPLSVAKAANFDSPSTFDNASLLAVSNNSAFQRYVHFLPSTWPGAGDGGVNSLGKVGAERYELGNSPVNSPAGTAPGSQLQDYRSASLAVQAHSVVKIRKPSSTFVYATAGPKGSNTGSGSGILFTKVGYAD